MALTCTPAALLAGAKCFDCGPIHKQHVAIQTYLLAQIAFNLGATTTTDPAALARLAKCMTCLTPKQIDAVIVYLLCQLANS